MGKGMGAVTQFTLDAVRESPLWLFSSPEIPEVRGRCRTIADMRKNAMILAAAHGAKDANLVGIRFTAEGDIDSMVSRVVEARESADEANRRLGEALRDTARDLTGLGITMRDVGELMGITAQRVGQLLSSGGRISKS